jgi:hypothetical protein
MPKLDPIEQKSKPTSKDVNDFHENADTNHGIKALHHTLGAMPSQASPGDHSHDGGSSQVLDKANIPALLDDVIIAGQLPNNPNTRDVLKRIIGALVRLGATDATT